MVFFVIKLFSTLSLNLLFFFRPYQKHSNTSYFFDSAHTILSLFRCHHIYLDFPPLFLIRKAVMWNIIRTELVKLPK